MTELWVVSHVMQSSDFQKLPEDWRRDWWFLDPRHRSHLSSLNAFKWELLRRSKAANEIRGRFVRARQVYCRPPGRVNRIDALRPSPDFDWHQSSLHSLVILHELNPSDRWIDIPESKQRAATELYGVLPSLNQSDQVSGMRFGVVRLSTGQQGKVHSANLVMTGDAIHTGGFDQCPVFQDLRVDECSDWFVVVFDSRVSPARLQMQFDTTLIGPFGFDLEHRARQLRNPDTRTKALELILRLTGAGQTSALMRAATWRELRNLFGDDFYPPSWNPNESVTPRAARRMVRVIPALYDPDVACFIPAACNLTEARPHFLNAIRHEKREKWLADCRAYWQETLPAHRLRQLPSLRLVKRGINFDSLDPWLALASYDLHNKRTEGAGKGLQPLSNVLKGFWLREHVELSSKPRTHQLRKAMKALKNLHSQVTELLVLVETET